ncbi:MAG: 1-acyl-sn-glycerol-3-phosphate acyltransferase [Bradymonadales bacterium]|nr:MAG: 1-acyl-sn-glycerol-3-phosphate acyltransferase [Bradymonadales bacterium]
MKFFSLSKLLGVVLVIALQWIFGLLLQAVLFAFPDQKRRAQIRVTHHLSQMALFFLGIRVHRSVEFPERARKKAGRLIVSNHLSYTDVLVLSAERPLVFVTSMDVKETPILGRTCAFGGSFFVERRNASRLREELRGLRDLLASGFDLAVFPEATSSDGMQVLEFKRALFQVLAGQDRLLLPASIAFVESEGRALNRRDQESFAYYGSKSFFSHLLQLVKRWGSVVRLSYLDPISCQAYSSADLATMTQGQISGSYLASFESPGPEEP